jgi:hypothetical protein
MGLKEQYILDRCIRNKNNDGSVFDERGILSFNMQLR